MLSIIICSVNPRLLEDLKRNLSATTGVEFELLCWDNREQNLGICRVYNMMAAKARFPFLCFIHEDIKIETAGWGSLLAAIFSGDNNPGIVGIAGGKYKARNLSGWYSGIAGMDLYHVSHLDGHQVIDLSNDQFWRSSEEEVVCIDGVFIAVKKEVWESHKFNEALLKGFHFYDLDFSFRVSRNFRAVVTKQIDVIHYTKGGDYGESWVREAFKFHDYWYRELPGSTSSVANAEMIVAGTWLERLKTEKISFATKMKWIKRQGLQNHKRLFLPIVKFIFYRPSGYFYLYKMAKKVKRKLVNG